MLLDVLLLQLSTEARQRFAKVNIEQAVGLCRISKSCEDTKVPTHRWGPRSFFIKKQTTCTATTTGPPRSLHLNAEHWVQQDPILRSSLNMKDG